MCVCKCKCVCVCGFFVTRIQPSGEYCHMSPPGENVASKLSSVEVGSGAWVCGGEEEGKGGKGGVRGLGGCWGGVKGSVNDGVRIRKRPTLQPVQ